MASLITWDFYRTWVGTADLPSGASDVQETFDLLNPQVGSMIENYLGRRVIQGTVTEQKRTQPDREIYHLRNFPVQSVTSVEYDPEARFESGSDYTVATDAYAVDLTTGRLWLDIMVDRTPFGLRVVYEGGMVADVATLETPSNEYHPIAVAAAQQINHLYDRRDYQGAESVSMGRANASYGGEAQLLEVVQQTLAPFRAARAG